MRHFTAAKAQRDFAFVAVFQKLIDVAHFHFEVVGIRVWTELYLFYFDDLLLFACLGFALLLFIFELAEIHDLNDRRTGIWRDFNKVEASLYSKFHPTCGSNYADIFAFCADKADFVGCDAFVNAGSSVALWWRVMRSTGYWLQVLCGYRSFDVANVHGVAKGSTAVFAV